MKKLRTISIFIILSCLLGMESFAYGFTVLIDPGHGGEDRGASKYFTRKVKGRFIKRNIQEKDISLSISKLIYKKLKKKKYRTFLTRSIDRTVSLEERAALAEKIQADLFISLHINSEEGRKAHGFETYYLDNHEDAAVKKVENIENRNLQGEELIVHKILTDLIIKKTVSSSRGLAQSIHQQIASKVGRKYHLVNRGVRPGLFYVLAMAKRPAILLEVGFLSNTKELKRLINKKFQERYAEAVVQGIDRYFRAKYQSKMSLF